MNSDKAAAVRDSLNGCPDVVGDDDHRERDGDPASPAGVDGVRTGDRVEPKNSVFRPASIEQSGTFGDGNGRTAPVFVVVLETLWTEKREVRSVSSEMVHEVAKHGCSLRFYPPEHRLGGAIWVVDHFVQDLSSSDGDRCPECEGTYFKLRDGEPECVRCGAAAESAQAGLGEVANG